MKKEKRNHTIKKVSVAEFVGHCKHQIEYIIGDPARIKKYISTFEKSYNVECIGVDEMDSIPDNLQYNESVVNLT